VITAPETSRSSLRVLFVVEGFTDIRFVVGLSQNCNLTISDDPSAGRTYD
jgi:hypothetical protein